MGSGGSSLLTDGGATTYLTSLTDNLSVGTSTALGLFTVSTSSATSTATFAQYGSGDILNLFDGGSEVFTVVNGGNVGLGSTTPSANLSIQGISGQTANLFAIASSTNANLFSITATGSIVFNGDTINDLTGSGLVVTGSALTASITPAHLNDIDTPGAGECLSYETATSFEWVTCGAGGGGAFTSGSGLTTLDTATDLVGIGTSTPTAKLAVVGDGGMTSPLFRLSSSTNEILFEVLADGSLDVNSGALYYDVATNKTSIERLDLGAIKFEESAGWVSMD